MEKIVQPQDTDTGPQQIEIVRNVRGGGFENYDAKAEGVSQHSGRPFQVQPAPEQKSDVLDVVDESAAAPRPEIITLSLFSNAKKDTDFTGAWKRLTDVLQNSTSPRIAIDFSNVLFLYDQELLYLEKFRDVVLQAGGTIAFVNCEAELSAVLHKHPRLSSFVGEGRT